MTSQMERIEGWRSLVRDYLTTVSSRVRLIKWAWRKGRDARNDLLQADAIFNWWDAFMQPNDPDILIAFSESEVAAISAYHERLLLFHETNLSKDPSVFSFVFTHAYSGLAGEARQCLQVLEGKG